jgi:hypothetical protein
VASLETQAADAASRAQRRRKTAWLPWCGASALAAVGLFFLYLRQAQTWPPDSDAAAIGLQAWNMLHGNLLLHGWWLADLSFYTTELPEYMLVESVRGLNPEAVHVCAALTYVLLVVLAALLARGADPPMPPREGIARGRTRGRVGIVAALLATALMLAPGHIRGTDALLGGPDHTGTAVPILLVLLLLDWADGWKRRWPVPLAVLLMLTWAQIADPLATYAAAAPLATVGIIRTAGAILPGSRLRPEWRYNLALTVAATGSVPLTSALMGALRSAGGFSVAPLTGPLLGPWSEVPTHALAVGQSILVLFGADYFGQPSQVWSVLAWAHMVAVAVAALGLLVGIFRFFTRLDRVGQTLVVAILVLIGAGVFGTYVPNVTYAHEIAPLLPLAAALAGRQLAPPLIRAKLAPALAVVLAGYLGALCYAATLAPVPPQNQAVADWLVAHGLTDGLAPYWQADSVSFDSGGRVTMVPLYPSTIWTYHWESKASWFDPRQNYANFVLTKKPPGGLYDSFGRPMKIYHYGQYTIMVWDKNLVPLVGPGVT